MREIKFRVWDKRVGMFEPDFINKEGYAVGNPKSGSLTIMTKNVMQYTGLKDKTGQEIYFGHIVEWVSNYALTDREKCRAVVAWSKSGQCWFPHINKDTEIIGNIYENSQLLEQTV